MDINKIKWCFDLKTGLSFVNPNENLSEIYLEKSNKSLKLLKKLEEDFDEWIISTAYYALYHRVYAALIKIGIKSKNHSCTIELISYFIPTLKELLVKYKTLRESIQYYGQRLKINKENILNDLLLAFRQIDEFRENLTVSKIKELREMVKEMVEL